MESLLAAYRAFEMFLKARFKLTVPQYEILLAIRLGGERLPTTGEVARRCYKANSTLTPMLDSLETLGWVKRERSRLDRRVVHVWLAEPAEFEAVCDQVRHVYGGYLERMAPELNALAANLESDSKRAAV